MATQIAIRHDTAANWAVTNPVLAKGEPGLDEETPLFKIGDGVTAWNDLPGVQLTAAGGGGGGGGPVGEVTSVAGRIGDVVLTTSDITDMTSLGQSVVTAPNTAAARSALGVTSLFGNAVVLSGATAARNDPTTGIALPAPPQCTVLWVASTLPANLVTGDIWLNDPNV